MFPLYSKRGDRVRWEISLRKSPGLRPPPFLKGGTQYLFSIDFLNLVADHCGFFEFSEFDRFIQLGFQIFEND